ncbi:major histocompatibility complex class I-related gene protein-like isoform X1 [Ctenopharyngodon idella]|uniref:major histocompatibility complex class I-related gene protein-like isoform X1 n=1 Tax=Ctenopharyngodon idella TaxID=7959 RepID=UPI00222F14C8|nr:major histocompatibility complex class I-related gene protein-like isoform X1 [Ctenopharyngodon idella]
MQSVILLVVALHVASGAIHSWKAYYTGTTGLSEFPEFVALNLIDDQLMGYFDSNTNRFKSQFKWMEDNLGKNYDEQETNTLQGYPAAFKNNIKVVMERFNQTQGVHTFQEMYGCEWDDQTRATNGFIQDGYDGEDFLSLDLKEMRWISPVQQGFITVQKWNKDSAYIESDKNYFSSVCIEWLKKYLEYGKSSLQKTVSPQVSLLQKDPSSPVTCHATGFYPSGVTITWMKNGQEHHEDVDLGELLPNEDGTFQKTSTIRVTPDEWKKNEFSCVVEHQGKTVTEDKIRTNNGESVSIGIIVGALAAVVLLIIIAVAGYVVYKKKQGFKPVSGSDDGSNSSAQAVPQA